MVSLMYIDSSKIRINQPGRAARLILCLDRMRLNMVVLEAGLAVSLWQMPLGKSENLAGPIILNFLSASAEPRRPAEDLGPRARREGQLIAEDI